MDGYIIDKSFVKPLEWKNKWEINKQNCGIIKIIKKNKNILNIYDIDASEIGYYGKDTKYNIGYDNRYGYYVNKYGDKQLKTIYHGSGGYDYLSDKEYRGGGIIYIVCKSIINYGNCLCNGGYGGSGSIFILSIIQAKGDRFIDGGDDKYDDNKYVLFIISNILRKIS